MNKNLKKIIAFAIICTSFSMLMPSSLGLGNQCAYAYSNDIISQLKVTSGTYQLSTYTSSGGGNENRIKTGDEVPIVIYSKLSSSRSNINLSAIQTDAADTRVFVGKSYFKLDDIYSPININKGEKQSIYIRLYDSKNAADDNYTAEYELVVERDDDGEVEVESQAEIETITLKDYDNIFLDSLSVSSNTEKFDLNFNKNQAIYNLNVPDKISSIIIKAVPEYEGYKLRINNKDVETHGTDDDKNTENAFLYRGQNIIKIRIISDKHETREYFLNIFRGQATTANTNNTTIGNTTSQNAQTGSGWQYRKADGTLAIGWLSLGNEWYYFDSTGSLKTGWIQPTPNKWYYLKESGAMAKNTIIDGYKLGSDGLYISKK